MTDTMESGEMRMIPIDLIDVLNTRERNKAVFDEIVGNIKSIGLKKPITVTPRPGPDGTNRYMLICGEGRMKAFQSLGEKTIPALVVDVTDENAYIMSLAENFGTKATTRRSSPRRPALRWSMSTASCCS
jgi:ParB family chromosome partitioning protein